MSRRPTAARIPATLLLAGVLLAGCNPAETEQAPAGGLDLAANAAEPAPAIPVEATADLEARARAALETVLRDAASAQLSSLRGGRVGSVCGMVAPAVPGGRHGDPLPFVVTASGRALVSSTPAVNLTDPNDIFPEFYAQMCATEGELAAMSATLRDAPPADIVPAPAGVPPVDGLPPETLPPEAAAPPPPVRAAPLLRPPAPARRPATPAPADGPVDSFTNAIMRPGEER